MDNLPILRCPLIGLWWLLTLGSVSAADDPAPATSSEWVLRGGLVVDGTGAPGRRADVAFRGDRIISVGDFEAGAEDRVLDVSGLVIAPGFIDLHTHSDRSILSAGTRSNRNYLAQGVTTIVTGNCGSGPIDVGSYLREIDERGAGTNVLHLVPHGSVRREVLGNLEVRPDRDGIARMERIVEQGMADGAWGMSTGLIYLPGRYAETSELVDLARVVARQGGIYASHIRNEGDDLLGAVEEAIRIGRESGASVHISHLKAGGRPNWGKLQQACAAITAAREAGQSVTADQYPYIASSTSLGAMVVPHWARQGDASDFARIADDPERGRELRNEIEEGLARRDGGSSIRISRYETKPNWVGRDLASIADAEGATPTEIVVEVMKHGDAGAISFMMSEDDVRFAMLQPFVATASDGSAHAPGGEDRPHPRSYGTFPRKLRYALDDEVISLEHAIRSSSGLPASILGLADRGVIREGSFADLVVFDPSTFRDSATFDDPTVYARGVRFLFVNGVATIMNGEYRGALAGRALRRPAGDDAADLILKVGRIWTGDPENPWATAVASREGEILAVGDESEVDRFRGSLTRVINRPDDFAVPGLIDAHGHMAMLGSTVDWIDLRGIETPERVAALVAEKARAEPGDGWVLGRNWDQSLWPDSEFPTANILDWTTPSRPVWLVRVDGHAAWANSEALRQAGVTAETPAPAGGKIIRDDAGRPTGVFVDDAMGLVSQMIPASSRSAIARRILAAQETALAAGLTGVHDAGLSSLMIDVYRELDRDGKLKIRIYGMASPPEGEEVDFASHPPALAALENRFTLRAIKLFIDGAMGSRGALLFEPYADDPENLGLGLISPEVLRDTTASALRNGWQVCTHAIGDKGNSLVLDAYEQALKQVPEATDARLRIEHAQVVRHEDVGRFRDLGIIASMQPSHASTDQRWADERLGTGSRRVAGAYAWSWFRDQGVRLAFGSDFPVEVPEPTWGLYAALTRRNAEGRPEGGWHPEHLMTLDETLSAFTAGSAFAAFAEKSVGVLRPGMRADLTVFDRDLFEVEGNQIRSANVTHTIIDGELVYETPAG